MSCVGKSVSACPLCLFFCVIVLQGEGGGGGGDAKDMKARDLALFAQIKLRIFKNVRVARFSVEDDVLLHFKLFQQALKLLLRGQLLSTE